MRSGINKAKHIIEPKKKKNLTIFTDLGVRFSPFKKTTLTKPKRWDAIYDQLRFLANFSREKFLTKSYQEMKKH